MIEDLHAYGRRDEEEEKRREGCAIQRQYLTTYIACANGLVGVSGTHRPTCKLTRGDRNYLSNLQYVMPITAQLRTTRQATGAI